MLHVGVAEIDITPPPGHPMAGYMARDGDSTGTHDHLFAQVLVMLVDGDQSAVLVTLDILGIDAMCANLWKQSIAHILQVPAENMMICASHTHCGPAGLQAWFGATPSRDTQLIQFIQNRLVEAGKQAMAALQPAQLTMSSGTLEGISGDRNRPENDVDKQVTVLGFENSDHKRIAILFHFACHPTVLGADCRLYSADLPGAARKTIRSAYPEAVALYLNGAAGNVSTRFTRRSQTFDEVERLGGLLGEKVLSLLDRVEQVDPSQSTPFIVWKHFRLELPFRPLADLPARSILETSDDQIEQTRAQGAAIEKELHDRFTGKEAQVGTLSLLGIGPCLLAFVPGEPFNDLAVATRQVSPFALVIGYANDYLGYFPTQRAIDEQTYEALSSPYDARAHALIESMLTTKWPDGGSSHT
jgi:neutral ceramidase